MGTKIIYISTEVEVDLLDYIDSIDTSDLLTEIEKRDLDLSDNKTVTVDLISANEIFQEAIRKSRRIGS